MLAVSLLCAPRQSERDSAFPPPHTCDKEQFYRAVKMMPSVLGRGPIALCQMCESGTPPCFGGSWLVHGAQALVLRLAPRQPASRPATLSSARKHFLASGLCARCAPGLVFCRAGFLCFRSVQMSLPRVSSPSWHVVSLTCPCSSAALGFMFVSLVICCPFPPSRTQRPLGGQTFHIFLFSNESWGWQGAWHTRG